MSNKKYLVNIVELPNKVLREKSKDVPLPLSQEDIELAEKMIYHVEDSIKPNSIFRPAVGVAA
ncbi:MAG: peptide deformylase, partial [Mycoplasmataceae bacterium]|nr:peptide deformylase [Mycoplasmataceae bacterium]